jgi:hypothetical protein
VLRSFLIVVGVVCLVGAIIAAGVGQVGPAFSAGIFGVLLLLGTLFERVIYKPFTRRKPANAVATSEKFVDERSGKTVTVYVDPATGERTYVEE